MQKSKAILIVCLSAFVMFSVTGCLKSTDSNTTTSAKAYLSILHLATAAPAPSVDIYFDANKVSSSSWTAGTVPTAYSAVDKGYYTINFKKASADSLVASVPYNMYDSLGFYTVVLYNQPSGEVNALLIEDKFSDLTYDKPYYRFIDASPGYSAVDLYIDDVKSAYGSGRTLADNQYATYLNEFKATTSGYHTLKVKISGTESTIATLDNVSLLDGNAYTFYLKGNPNGTGSNTVGIGVLRAAN